VNAPPGQGLPLRSATRGTGTAGGTAAVGVDHNAAVHLRSGCWSAPTIWVNHNAALTGCLSGGCGDAPSIRVNVNPAVAVRLHSVRPTDPGPDRRQAGPPPARRCRGAGGVHGCGGACQGHCEGESCHDTSSSSPHLHPPETAEHGRSALTGASAVSQSDAFKCARVSPSAACRVANSATPYFLLRTGSTADKEPGRVAAGPASVAGAGTARRGGGLDPSSGSATHSQKSANLKNPLDRSQNAD
jgi:hypothetical protein